MPSKGFQLKALIHAPEVLITPGVFDGFSTRLVEKMGFKTATISGAGLSESRLGWVDRGIMGYDENVRACRSLAECSNLLLQGDADTGYGNAMNVYFTVRGFEAAGLAAVMIEDQVWPKRCGHMAGKAVIPADEMVQKIKAATDARRDQDFVIKARTDAAGVLGLNEAIDRLNLYAEAGADCLFADALLSEADIEKVTRSISKPLSVNMGLGIRSRPTTPLVHPKRLQAMGVAQISYPRLLTSAGLLGMMNAISAFTAMLSGDQPVERPDLVASFDDINSLLGMKQLEGIEAAFLAGASAPLVPVR
jgi:2-methylisocitrate lyase-like PEP mutase family enzyme